MSCTRVEIVCADVIKWAEEYKGEKFHASFCDPPYELGFMGKDWDRSGIAFNPDTWAALAEHLHPGAFGMAFASSRGWHRLAVAIEDAGLRIHPSIFGWAYGSGFPKATRIDTQVDRYKDVGKLKRLSREIARARSESGLALAEVGERVLRLSNNQYGKWYHRGGHMFFETGKALPSRPEWEYLRVVLPISEGMKSVYDEAERAVVGCGQDSGKRYVEGGMLTPGRKEWDITVPSTPLAQQWQGHRYGLQALKPALEPIIVFQKPYPKGCKTWESIVETGAGALWIDGGRVGVPYDGTRRQANIRSGNLMDYQGRDDTVQQGHPQGRWPANFCLVHHPECEKVMPETLTVDDCHNPDFTGWRCVESCPVRKLGEQSGERSSARKSGNPNNPKRGGNSQPLWGMSDGRETVDFRDTGTAARFFHQSDWSYEIAERLAESSPVMYCAKASRKERDAGLEEMPLVSGLTEQVAEIRNQDRYSMSLFCKMCGKRNDYSCTCNAGWEQKPQPGLNRKVRNPHPTVKPISLCRWLATLLLPPSAYSPRRLLVPFAGTGSEGIGAMQAGWEYILGIEMGAGTCEIAVARIKYWQGVEKAKSSHATIRPDQLKMF